MRFSKTLLLAMGLTTISFAAEAKQTICVFDFVGKNGDVYALMKDYQLAAKNWGADIELKVNQNEAVIAEDFKAGKCDGISVSGMRGRQFNSFTGSLDAIGAIPDLKLAVKVMQGLASQTFSKYMVNGRYEVVGVIPVGDAYSQTTLLFIQDSKKTRNNSSTESINHSLRLRLTHAHICSIGF
uniref:putative solute-binding protein n=1 Tax=Acinetobacter baumannii TaxID=470 RepID=UPI0021C592E7